MDSEQKFLNRLFVYRLQYFISFIMAVICYFLVFFAIVNPFCPVREQGGYVSMAPSLVFSLFNTFTYLWSLYLAKKYGIEMFSDLDQKWLKEHQAFDSKAFGKIFAKLIQCRKIAGLYLLIVITPLALLHMEVAAIIGILYIIVYLFYRSTYLDDSLSYKVPRVFGGGGEVISKIIDDDFNEKIDELNKNLKQKK